MFSKKKLICPECGGEKLHKAGKVWSGRKRVQNYRCQSCGRSTMCPKEA